MIGELMLYNEAATVLVESFYFVKVTNFRFFLTICIIPGFIFTEDQLHNKQ
jgi:hypothetical protein